jgi:expansin (peptidoglycan-binding protein)
MDQFIGNSIPASFQYLIYAGYKCGEFLIDPCKQGINFTGLFFPDAAF